LAAFQRIAVADSPGIGPVLSVNVTNVNEMAEYGERTSHRILRTLLSMPATVLIGTFTLLSSYTLLSLLLYHAIIISVSQTTNERVRGVYRYGSASNASDRGCVGNWITACCHRTPPSRLPLDFSAVIRVDRNGREAPWNGEMTPSNAVPHPTTTATTTTSTNVPPLNERTDSGTDLPGLA